LPLYDYRCRSCSKVTEVRHGFREPHTGACPSCGGELARVFNPAGIVFKGSGFYINDSRKSGGSDGSSTPAPSTTPAAAAGDAKPAATATPPASTPASGDSGPKKSESSAA
jgi:putative FmdB family regulatory protein